ncbi:Bacteroides conjugative transposon TraM protein [Pedobacter suwonensis]|uniref:Bacteroides conjugative transposon TraM protein n=1 Tax=Pedobacter suwonensis TaxID=332999 RepID=A0A1I0SNL2_9SPHI|nr:conjugative transposon protein TraM [Pedobacter suwonensis]SFA41078.1 Bacteroides conjugative transposon TraM protein [Pedobacter suwonensis]
MKINLKQARYVVPLLALPFLCLFFYVYKSSAGRTQTVVAREGMNSNVADISEQVRQRGITDKLDAYRDRYKESHGNSVINNIEGDEKADVAFNAGKEKNTFDSIDRVLKRRGTVTLGSSIVRSAGIMGGNRGKPKLTAEDRAMAEALSSLAERDKPVRQPVMEKVIKAPDRDPMEVFKKQMSYMDSMGKANDPEYQAELRRKEKLKLASPLTLEHVQPVTKARAPESDFNTVMAEKDKSPILALIDENVIGYSGSRIRIRILEDLFVGSMPLKKGTFLYAEISGFSQQRVKLSITSIAREDKIIPVRLEIYDLDGLEGLYIPSSNFREFSRNLGNETIQGFSTEGGAKEQQEFLMSTLDRIFTSTSSAISGLIRKNKAKIKYNSRIYLIDPQSFQKQSK